MVNEPRTIAVDSEGELGRAFAEEAEVVLARGGIRYRVRRADGPRAGYEPTTIRAGLRAIAGVVSAEQAEQMGSQVYQGCDDGTRLIRRLT